MTRMTLALLAISLLVAAVPGSEPTSPQGAQPLRAASNSDVPPRFLPAFPKPAPKEYPLSDILKDIPWPQRGLKLKPNSAGLVDLSPAEGKCTVDSLVGVVAEDARFADKQAWTAVKRTTNRGVSTYQALRLAPNLDTTGLFRGLTIGVEAAGGTSASPTIRLAMKAESNLIIVRAIENSVVEETDSVMRYHLMKLGGDFIDVSLLMGRLDSKEEWFDGGNPKVGEIRYCTLNLNGVQAVFRRIAQISLEQSIPIELVHRTVPKEVDHIFVEKVAPMSSGEKLTELLLLSPEELVKRCPAAEILRKQGLFVYWQGENVEASPEGRNLRIMGAGGGAGDFFFVRASSDSSAVAPSKSDGLELGESQVQREMPKAVEFPLKPTEHRKQSDGSYLLSSGAVSFVRALARKIEGDEVLKRDPPVLVIKEAEAKGMAQTLHLFRIPSENELDARGASVRQSPLVKLLSKQSLPITVNGDAGRMEFSEGGAVRVMPLSEFERREDGGRISLADFIGFLAADNIPRGHKSATFSLSADEIAELLRTIRGKTGAEDSPLKRSQLVWRVEPVQSLAGFEKVAQLSPQVVGAGMDPAAALLSELKFKLAAAGGRDNRKKLEPARGELYLRPQIPAAAATDSMQ